jgi:hypothetical protein
LNNTDEVESRIRHDCAEAGAAIAPARKVLRLIFKARVYHPFISF